MARKTDEIVKHLINSMFEKAGHNVTYDDIKDRKDDWFNEYTMTMAQHDEWMEESVAYLRKRLRFNEKACRKEMGWFSLMYGLKFSDYGG